MDGSHYEPYVFLDLDETESITTIKKQRRKRQPTFEEDPQTKEEKEG